MSRFRKDPLASDRGDRLLLFVLALIGAALGIAAITFVALNFTIGD